MGMRPADDVYFIDKVKSKDQGMYSCMASNAAGTIVANATLNVLVNPHFIEPMTDKEVEQGESAVLECETAGNPQPKLQWLKDGEPLVITDRHFFTAQDQLLIIVGTTAIDSGEYTCVMTNTLGSERGTSLLTVLTGGHIGAVLGGDTTTTGIIIITVVCGVVGTSIVWVIIIYHTRRKRHGDQGHDPGDLHTQDGSPHPLVGGGQIAPPYAYKTYAEVNGAFNQSKMHSPMFSQDPSQPLTMDDHQQGQHIDTLHSWRRHSDSDSSHSTQSTRSTGLLSTFHPTATLPRPAVSTLSYTPADSTARQHALPSSSPAYLHPAVPVLSYTPSDSRAQQQHASLGEVAVLSSSHTTPSVAVVHAMPQCVGDEGEGHSPAGHEDQPPDAEIYSNMDASDLTPSHSSVSSAPPKDCASSSSSPLPAQAPSSITSPPPHPPQPQSLSTSSHLVANTDTTHHSLPPCDTNSCHGNRTSFHGDHKHLSGGSFKQEAVKEPSQTEVDSVPVIQPPPPLSNHISPPNGIIPGSTPIKGVIPGSTQVNGVIPGSQQVKGTWLGNGHINNEQVPNGTAHVIPNGHVVSPVIPVKKDATVFDKLGESMVSSTLPV